MPLCRARKNLFSIRSLAFAILIASQLSCVAHRDAQATFEHARQTLRRGEMSAAGEEAEQGYREFHNLSAELGWKFAILKARVEYWKGNNDRVLAILSGEPASAPRPELIVQEKRLEALAVLSIGRPLEAEKTLGEAEQICVSSPNSECGDLPTARGVFEMSRAHYLQAQNFFARALTSARQREDRFLEATALLNLSWSANEQAHFDEALDWANGAREIAMPQNFSDLAQAALGNMGWAYYKLGDPEKAEGMFVESRRQAEKLNDLTDQAVWLQALGSIQLEQDKFTDATTSYQQSLKLARQIKSQENEIDSLTALAFVAEQTNKIDDAKRYTDEVLPMARQNNNGREVVYQLLVQGRVAARLHDTAAAESAFRQVTQDKDTPVFLKWEAERSLARLYEDEKQSGSADHQYQTALSTFETARSELKHEDSRLPFLTNASRIYDDYIHFLVAQGKPNQALQVAEYSRGRTLTEGLGLLQKGSSFKLDPVNAQEIARRAGGTVLFYWLGEEQSYLWAITPQKIALFTLPPVAEIKTRVERYRKAIIDQRESLPAASDDGATLYRILVEPAKDLLPKVSPQKDRTEKSASADARVFIIPDGTLNSLNFETLLVSERLSALPDSGSEPHYWIEDATLSTASSLRMLQAFHATRTKGAGNLLLFGDAVSPSKDFPHLPKAAVEMTSIEKHFASAQQQVFSGDQANPTAYLASKPERFSYLHFVAHGTASRLSPLDSAIVLSKTGMSKAGAEEDSFKLYARDIIQHPLRAELVTVSTCRSAGARAYSGEGLVGLSWAFVRAGAHNVIGALWDVSDASTPQLMDELYSELKKGETPDAALRHAKLKLLRSRLSFSKPFYWAPFQIYTGS